MEAETSMVDESVVKDPMSYNITAGGHGTWTREMRHKGAISLSRRKIGGYWATNGERDIFLNVGDIIPTGFVTGRSCMDTRPISDRMKAYNEANGNPCKNPEIAKKATAHLSGKFWITNGELNKFVKEGESIPEGYKKGRTIKKEAATPSYRIL